MPESICIFIFDIKSEALFNGAKQKLVDSRYINYPLR
jgi:hypothetical protein